MNIRTRGVQAGKAYQKGGGWQAEIVTSRLESFTTADAQRNRAARPRRVPWLEPSPEKFGTGGRGFAFGGGRPSRQARTVPWQQISTTPVSARQAVPFKSKAGRFVVLEEGHSIPRRRYPWRPWRQADGNFNFVPTEICSLARPFTASMVLTFVPWVLAMRVNVSPALTT